MQLIENLENEIWKDIEGYEGRYQVSNLGRIKSLERYYKKRKYNECIKKQRLNKDGYCVVSLSNKESEKVLLVHRLVAKAFIPNDDFINKFQVNHKDEVKTNNNVNNLEWCTNEYNFNYNNRNALNKSMATRESKRVNGILKNKRSRNVLQINPNTNEIIKEYETLKDVANQTGYSAGTIYTSCNKGTINYGFKWKFKEGVIS